MGSQIQQFYVLTVHKDGSKLAGKTAHQNDGKTRHNRSRGKNALSKALHTIIAFRTPVVADSRLHGVAKTIQHGLHQVAAVHQHCKSGDRQRTSHLQQKNVHHQREQTACNIIEECRTATGNDALHHLNREFWLAEFQNAFSPDKWNECNDGADTKTGVDSNGRTNESQLQDSNK